MSWHCEEVQEKSLKPAADKNAYNLHLAALDWSLVEPIIINKAEDIKASNWRERGLTPYTHQIQNLITFCRRLPVGLIADDVGLGKTISAGLIVSELISRRKVSRILIVCPKVLTSQWVSELEEKFGLFGREYTGRALGAAFNSKTQIVVTTYQSVSNRLEKIQDGMFDMIILDEAHKLRNLYGGNSVPAIALNIRNAFQRRPFKYVLMLTATPIQNKIWDLYSLIDILKVAEGKANPLGNSTDFAETYLEPKTNGRILIKGMARQFQNMVRDCISRTRRGDISLHFPRRIIELFRVPLTREESKMIMVVGQHIDQLSALLQTSLAQAMMSSPRALVEQVRNMVRKGTLNPSVLTEIEQLASNVKIPAKLEYLINWIETLIKADPSTWRVVVFTVRLETQSMLFQEFKNKGFKVGLIKGGDHQANQKTIESYKTNPPTINLIVSSDAGAEGINLQAGNTLINYDLPWNPMVVEQRIGRVQRLGSAFESVSIGNMVGQGTIEDRIVGRLTEKLQGISQAVGDIEGILEAANLDDEDGDQSYEGRIRNLVVNALKGADVSKIQASMEKDIEVAKVTYEGEKANLDATLGNSGTDHSAVKAMPRIETKPPQMPFRDFVLSAMASNGYRLAHKSEAIVEASKPGMPLERISFSENDLEHGNAVFGGTNIKQYIPGKPHFERLVQHWVDHHGHHVIDTSRSVRTLANDLASEWVACFPKMKFLEAEFKPENESFFGNYYLRVRAATGVDSYEKIIFGQINPDLEIPVDQSVGFPVSTKETKLSELAPFFQDLAQAQANSDKDIGRFCDFYLNRLQEGLQQAGNDAVNERKLASDFRPIVHAEVVGLEGYQYQKGIVKIRVEIDSFQYAINIPAIPSSKNLLEQPSVSECNVTGFRVPIAFLEKCASTGVFALRHKMEKYGDNGFVVPGQLVTCSYLRKPILRSDAVEDLDGSFTHKSYMVVCEHTGKTIRMVKATKSYSGRWGSNDIIFTCPISPLKCLPDETVVCKATGRQVCQANAVQSIVTGDWYGNDQLSRSDISANLAPPPDMVVCQATNSKIILSESAVCNVCNKRLRKDYLVTSAASGRQFCRSHAKEVAGGRIALPEEVGSCAISGKTLLLGELIICQDTGETISKQLAGVCSLSGKTLRQSLLVNCAATGVSLARKLVTELAGGRFSLPSACGKCAMTGKFYLLNELVKCELTGDSVARGCLGECSITQAKVRRDRLVQVGPSTSSTQIISNPTLFYCPALTVKDHHGKMIPLKDSRKCAVSKIISHISETKVCQHTGVFIHESMAATCQISNKVVRKDILLKSSVSGILMLREFAVQITDGGFGTAEETGLCHWSGKTVERALLEECTVTDNPVCKEFLNKKKELKIVRKMLDGTNMGSVVDADKLSRLRANPQISSWIKGKVTENPAIAADTYVVSALHFGLLGINVKVYLAVMRSDPDGEKVLGKIVIIGRRGGFWWILDT